ncbi:hypothetical protein DOY81_000208, partial [Sarcophaga bullata]
MRYETLLLFVLIILSQFSQNVCSNLRGRKLKTNKINTSDVLN